MKHPLLPEMYADAAMHRSLLQALRPYSITDNETVNNPAVKWDLRKAEKDADPLLAKAIWKCRENIEGRGAHSEWEMAADNDTEIAILLTITAGLVAQQIRDGESDISIRRIDYRSGGEVALVISGETQRKLKEHYPEAEYLEHGMQSSKANGGLLDKLRRLIGY